MNQNEIYHLIERYNAGNASEEETAFLESWYLHQAAKPSTLAQTEVNAAESIMLTNLKKHIAARQRIKLWPRFIGIAAAVIGIAICVYLFTTPRHPDASLSSRANAKDLNDVAPGGNRATLTFANGNKINLSDKKSGVIVGDALKYDDNTFVIQSDSEGPKDRSLETRDDKVSEAITATTPKGGTYSIILQDGTKVWLNADSKLEFFSNYRNKLQRIVKLLAGEAYFEVAKNKAKPFKVQCNGQEITVLGTHFNINAYNDDTGIKTTLLEGSVKVSSTLSSRTAFLSSRTASLSSRANAKDLNTDPSEVGMTRQRDGEAVTLKPNQQSLVAANSGAITIKQVNAADAIDWKNGYFKFANEPLGSIMQKVSRWYNVEVEYKNENLRQLEFGGTVSRYDKVSAVLSKLELTGGVKFKINGNKIIISDGN